MPFENELLPYHHDKVRVFFPTEELSRITLHDSPWGDSIWNKTESMSALPGIGMISCKQWHAVLRVPSRL